MSGSPVLGGPFFASKMMGGRHPPMVYQFAFSVMVAIVGGALTTQQPVDATVLRIALMLVGAVSGLLKPAGDDRLRNPLMAQWSAASLRGRPTVIEWCIFSQQHIHPHK